MWYLAIFIVLQSFYNCKAIQADVLFSPILNLVENDFQEPIDQEVKILLLIGAAKAGSSFLYSLLSSSTSIVGGNVKEPHLLDSIEQISTRRYLSSWRQGTAKSTWLIDGTPENLYYPISALRANVLMNMGVKVKAVAILRNPVERAYSEWYMLQIRCRKLKLQELFKRAGVYTSWHDLYCRPFSILLEEELSALHSSNCTIQETRSPNEYIKCFGNHVKCYSKRVKNNTLCHKHHLKVHSAKHVRSVFDIATGMITKGNYEPQIKMWKKSIGEDNLLVIQMSDLRNISYLETSISKLLATDIRLKALKKSKTNVGRYARSNTERQTLKYAKLWT